MSLIQIALLDPMQVRLDAELLTEITSPKIQALLAYLTVEADRAHGRGDLADLLWPGQSTGRQNLRQSLRRLQKALPAPADGPPLLQATRSQIRWHADAPHRLDLREFTGALASVRDHRHADPGRCSRCAARLAAAVALYRGDFLADLAVESPPFDEWALLKREWLRREALWALDILVQHAYGQANPDDAYRYAWQRLGIDPLAEDAHRQVMEALARGGRRDEAQRGLALAEKGQDRLLAGQARALLGRIHLSASRFGDARAVLERGLAGCRADDSPAPRLELLGALADLHLARRQVASAPDRVEAVLPFLLDPAPMAVYDLMALYLSAHGDPRAATVLETARRTLERWARPLPPERRRTLLEGVPAHRRVGQLYRAQSDG